MEKMKMKRVNHASMFIDGSQQVALWQGLGGASEKTQNIQEGTHSLCSLSK